MKVLTKLRSRSGESLAEVLCAVLLAGIAISLLASMVTSAAKLNRAAALADEAKIPVPASTVSGETILYALKPDVLIIDGRASDALVAPLGTKLRGADAIIPYRIFGEAR